MPLKGFVFLIFFFHIVEGGSNLAVITGCTGVLGQSLVKRFLWTKQYTVRGIYRNEDKVKGGINSYGNSDVELIKADLAHIEALPIIDWSNAQNVVLVNNAATCLPGSTKELMRSTLRTNCMAPIHLMRDMICARDIKGKATIINISSGDGELVQLNSHIQRLLASVQSIGSLQNLCEQLIKDFDPTLEYAHGSTPLYSLSKAILNRATQLLHVDDHFRVLSMCPGNFQSPMTSEEESITDLRPVDAVSEEVLQLAEHSSRYAGGRFYRYLQPINW